MTTVQVEVPPKLKPVFSQPRGSLRYRGAYGGRGSGKSFTFAKMAAIWGYAEKLRILCTREMQNSIKESFHAELKNAIASEPWLENAYTVGVDYIRGKNGTEFIFRGLRHNQGSIKSLAQIDLCIVEEAEDVPETSWQILEPTIRAPKSEIWVIWNRRLRGSPTDQRFIENTPPRAAIVELNHGDNPWFPSELEEQRQYALQTMDAALYQHVWEGDYYEQSDAQIFSGKWRIDDFEPDSAYDGPYFGLDFGFAQDPTAAVECWIKDESLYIRREAGRVGLELDDTAPFVKSVMPGVSQHVVRADCARPESISFIKRNGMPLLIPASKWSGSVEDGIEFMRSFRSIIVHSDCVETARELRLYSYKVDRLSGDIRPIPVDAFNHYIDAIRYALEPMIGASRGRKPAGPPKQPDVDAWGRRRQGGESWKTM
jgi:phage terminase large subunit